MKLSAGTRAAMLDTLLLWALAAALFGFALLYASCATSPAPVTVTPEPPPAQAALDATLQAQIEALKTESAAKSEQLDTVAASVAAVQIVGLPNTPPSDGKPVIEREAGVIAAAAGEPSPEARAAALERANAQLHQDLARADALYGKAIGEAKHLQEQLAEQAAVIAARRLKRGNRR